MAHYLFLVGPTAAGKSTTERNLRLRLTGELKSGLYQFVPDQGLVFAGRVLFNRKRKILRFSGGDATGYKKEYVLQALQAGEEEYGVKFNKVIFEQYRVSNALVEELVSKGEDVTFLHIDIDRDLIIDRLIALDHPKAEECNPPYDRPVDKDFQEKRDQYLAGLGVQVIYIGGDVLERCQFIERMLGLTPKYDHVLYDFDDSLDVVQERFLSGGDPPRSIDDISLV